MLNIFYSLACARRRGGITHGDMKPLNNLLGADLVRSVSNFDSTVFETEDLTQLNGILRFRGTVVYTPSAVEAGQLPTAASEAYTFGISFLQLLGCRLRWWRTVH
ncbi:hypothetical protein JIQ42_02233 [Leishmania sp. Namibia]|uniref:hypothetical protein n=1 Tax=Leishmania sp. Namibia TaxID=2802991 RepID=UPI001B75239B|nr:hypothetical protein JIQ42_02233 [Leishmania sp. Namibia]